MTLGGKETVSKPESNDAAERAGGSLERMVGRTVEELETDCRIWQENAHSVLYALDEAKAKNKNLLKLIWAIVLKHGGEIRLDDLERGILRDDWELLEYTDMETLELVIKARSAPNADLRQDAGSDRTNVK